MTKYHQGSKRDNTCVMEAKKEDLLVFAEPVLLHHHCYQFLLLQGQNQVPRAVLHQTKYMILIQILSYQVILIPNLQSYYRKVRMIYKKVFCSI
jgi:hypothetical protein